MMQMYLIRHGITDSNKEGRVQGSINTPLNETGLAQAKSLAGRFASIPVDAVFSSPLTRAKQTAAAIATVKNLPVTLVNDLRELNAGLLEGRTHAENMAQFPEQMRYLRGEIAKFAAPEGESTLQVYTRVQSAIYDILLRNKDKTIVVVSHGFAIQTYIGFLKGIPLARLKRYDIKNASVSCVQFDADIQGELLFCNDISHLEAEM